MTIIADLHIHGKYSQATSKDLNFSNLEKYAKMKGVTLLGTGDFTHPKWIEEIKHNLKDHNSTGIFTTQKGFPFILQTEISLVYTQDGKGRRVHNIIFAKDLDSVSQITEYLLTKGRIDYDGRPIFKIPCPEFVEALKNIDKKIEIIPAHIWTPWFSMFGSKSGFNSVKECFGNQAKHIHAYETGISSDPAMNWRVSQLDSLTPVSFSDIHSYWPWRMGREATLFDCKLDYDSIMKAIRTRKGYGGTIEVDPNYGKYHYDGHRKCDVCMSPVQTMKHKGVCPVCRKPLTIGVDYRVEELADRPLGYKPKDAKSYYSLLPLSEIISIIRGKAMNTKTVWSEYNNLANDERSEFDILLKTPHEELKKISNPEVADAIIRAREGKVRFRPGYDGEYGTPVFDENENIEETIYEIPSEEYIPQKTLGKYT